jgi:hypothetical protein
VLKKDKLCLPVQAVKIYSNTTCACLRTVKFMLALDVTLLIELTALNLSKFMFISCKAMCLLRVGKWNILSDRADGDVTVSD